MSKLRFIRKAALTLIQPWPWRRRPLRRRDLAADPFEQFTRWYERAQRCIWIQFPEALCLATSGVDGYPEGRQVLLKGYSSAGFVFYTNSKSAKGQALLQSGRASLNFYWEPLQRQVRIQGDCSMVDPRESDAYFASRPRLSQLGAWASEQSRPLEKRELLEQRLEECRAKFAGRAVTRPPHWCGQLVTPRRFEFWQLRPNRLHDRFVYSRQPDGEWQIERLYP